MPLVPEHDYACGGGCASLARGPPGGRGGIMGKEGTEELQVAGDSRVRLQQSRREVA